MCTHSTLCIGFDSDTLMMLWRVCTKGEELVYVCRYVGTLCSAMYDNASIHIGIYRVMFTSVLRQVASYIYLTSSGRDEPGG